MNAELETNDRQFAEPFQPTPAKFPGCGKPAVIGCGLLLLLLGIGLGVLMWKAKDLLAFSLQMYRTAVFEALPEDYSDAERERLDRAFGTAAGAIRAGDLDAADLQRLQRFIGSPPRSGEQLDREQLRLLTEALESIGGIGVKEEEPVGPAAPAAREVAQLSRTVVSASVA